MGKKYEIDYLRDEGLMRLKLEFPEKLDDFDKILKSFPRTHIKCGNVDEQCDMELEVINLAQECGVKTILPALYFQVIQKMVSKAMVTLIVVPNLPGRQESSTEM